MEREEAIILHLSRIHITLEGNLDTISFLGHVYKR